MIRNFINWSGIWYWVTAFVWIAFVVIAIGIVFYQVWQIARQVVIQ